MQLASNFKLLNFYYKLTKPFHFSLLILFVFPILWCSAESIAPYLIKLFIDNVSTNAWQQTNPKLLLIKLTLIYGSLMLVMEVSLRLCHYFWIKALPKIRLHLKNDIFQLLLEKSIAFYTTQQNAEIVLKIKNLSNNFIEMVSSILYGIFPVIVSAFVVLILLIDINAFLVLFFFAWFIGMNALTFFYAKQSIHKANIHAKNETKFFSFIGDLFENILAVKTSDATNQNNRFSGKYQHLEKASEQAVEWLTFKVDTLRSIISFGMLCAMMFVLCWGWLANKITLGDFSFVTATCFYVRRSAWVCSINLLKLFNDFGVANRAFQDLSLDDPQTKTQHIETLSETHKSTSKKIIQIKNVSFSYNVTSPLFQNVCLDIVEGEKLLIVGTSGSGKTTLIHLILGLITPQKGNIFIKEPGSQNASPQALLKYITYVPQFTTLFSRSIYDNITYGNTKTDPESVHEAARLAKAHDFISELTNGYQTVLGAHTKNLSGGQRQRIALARAFLRDAPILILDEATSALDDLMEKEILLHLTQHRPKQTHIMITHHTRSNAFFNRCIKIEKGKIFER